MAIVPEPSSLVLAARPHRPRCLGLAAEAVNCFPAIETVPGSAQLGNIKRKHDGAVNSCGEDAYYT